MAYVRRVKTVSGAMAVQIVEKRGGVRRVLEHVGSAHGEVELAVLMQSARERLHAGQQALDLPTPTAAPGPQPVTQAASTSRSSGSRSSAAVITGSVCEVLWEVLREAYRRLGFQTLDDDAFRALVLARIVEPTSKLAAVGVLSELGVPAPHRNTFTAALKRCIDRDYRAVLSTAATVHAARSGPLALVLYDVTTLHFEAEAEDDLRRVGMSKERRVDPQLQVGLLVDRGGFPLEVHCFEGNTAETRTLLPVLEAFQVRHGVTDMVVVADAGMLSAVNLNAIEDAGCSFIVGSRISADQ